MIGLVCMIGERRCMIGARRCVIGAQQGGNGR
jgi:hypothetical protein